MKLPPRKKYWKKRLIIIFSVAILVLAGLTAASYHYQYWPFTPTTHKPSPEEQDKLNKEKAVEDKEKSQTTSPDVDASRPTTSVPVSTTVSLEVTSLLQSDSNVTYAATITNPGESGTCSAVFTNDIAKPVTRTTDANGTSCGPVSIPELEFSAVGQWTLTLRYYSSGIQAVATKTVEVK